MKPRALIVAIGLFAWSLPPAHAVAHAPPQIWRVARRDSDGSVALLTNRGIIFADGARSSFRFMCNTALGVNTSEQPYLAYTPDGRLLASTSMGLQATTDGCSWQSVSEFGMAATPAIAQDPAQPEVLYVATFAMGKSGIEVSKDAGATWSWLAKVADNDFVQEVFVAPSSSKTIYYSGEVFSGAGMFTHYVARSDDGGATFARSDVALLSTEADLTLLAVSPGDPAVVLARAQDGSDAMTMDRLLVSRDGGKSFTPVLTVPQLFSAAWAADGQTAWVASIGGLWRSRDAAKSFEQIMGPTRMTFVGAAPAGKLWAGGWFGGTMDLDGWAESSDDGNDFTSLMAFPQVVDTVACDAASSTATKCEMLWKDWQYEILKRYDIYGGAAPPPGVTPAPMGSAAGPADAGTAKPDASALVSNTDADAATLDGGSRPNAKHSSGCSVREPGLDRGSTALGLVLLIALGARARKRSADR
jgi:hypothetical protein